MKYRIETVKKKFPNGYVGLNCRAAGHLHIPFNHKKPKHTIVVWEGLNKQARKHTIHHEEIEAQLMKNHMSYKKAHKFALKWETKQGFPEYHKK